MDSLASGNAAEEFSLRISENPRTCSFLYPLMSRTTRKHFGSRGNLINQPGIGAIRME